MTIDWITPASAPATWVNVGFGASLSTTFRGLNGDTPYPLMAVSGHSSLDQVQVYIDEVEQEPAAGAAMTKLTKVPEIKTATAND
jgi:hypothetical protein